MNRTNDVKRILYSRMIAELQNKKQAELARVRKPTELEDGYVKNSCWPASKR